MSNVLVMSWLLSLGFMPTTSLEIKDASINASNCLVQTLGVQFDLAEHLRIYSTVEIRETKSRSIYFDPFRGDFLLGGALYFKNLSIGVSHECNHDIVTNTQFHEYNGWEAAFDKAYINYTIPFHIVSGVSIRPSITIADQFTEAVRIKSNNKYHYFDSNKMKTSPNILFSDLRLEMEVFFLRPYAAFQAGITTHNGELAYTQFNIGAALFYKNISIGVDYIDRNNVQKNAGYSLEGLRLFIRFQGKASLL
jgi:hypothetical protein